MWRKKLAGLGFGLMLVLLTACGKTEDASKKSVQITTSAAVENDTIAESSENQQPETETTEEVSGDLIEVNVLEEGYFQEGELIYRILKGEKTVEVSIKDGNSEEVVIPEKATDEETGKSYQVVKIADNCFAAHEELVSVSMPDTITDIGKEAFTNCIALEQVKASSNLEVIGDSAFFGCEALTELSLPEGLKKIEDEAFSNCFALKELEIPSTVEFIGDEAFWACYELKELIIPEGVKTIGTRAFYDCGELTRVSLPESLEGLDEDAFLYDLSMKELIVPKSKLSFYQEIFKDYVFNVVEK